MKTATKKENKYNYVLVIQQHYGRGTTWEDNSEYEATSTGIAKDRELLKHDLKEYKLTGYATRVIFRKELNK